MSSSSLPSSMISTLVTPDVTSSLTTVPVPTPGPNEVLIKVIVAGANPKDWKLPLWTRKTYNTGDDVAGTVVAVGEGVYEFKPGDRVAAFHHWENPYGAYAEYAIASDRMTFRIPEKTSFEEAATIPLAALTAVVGLYKDFRLPQPWTPSTSTTPTPLVVLGAGTAVGAFVIKLARLSNIHPIIATVGRAKEFAEGLIDPSRGDELVDYRGGSDAVVSGIKAALKRNGFESADYIFDCVSEHGSVLDAAQVVTRNAEGKVTGKIAGVLSLELDDKAKELDEEARKGWGLTLVGWVHEHQWPEGSQERKDGVKIAGRELGYVYLRFFGRGLNEGWFNGHPYQAVEGGLERVGWALRELKEGRSSAVKFVFKVADTKGVDA